MRTLALLLTDANQPWFGGVSQGTDPQTARKVSYIYCQSSKKIYFLSTYTCIFSALFFRAYDWCVCKWRSFGWLQEPKEDAFSYIFLLDPECFCIICQIGCSVMLVLDSVMLLDLAEGLHGEKDSWSFQKLYNGNFPNWFQLSSVCLWRTSSSSNPHADLLHQDHWSYTDKKLDVATSPRERRGWEWRKLNRTVNLEIFDISELPFSQTMGNKAALKNGLMKHISEIFTIQVQADFDRDIRRFDPNKYRAALR